jgi:hypothetical protein
MSPFILEILVQRGWRRGGEIFWTIEDAKRAGDTMLKRRIARRVRVLPVNVELQPVAELPKAAEGRGRSEPRGSASHA